MNSLGSASFHFFRIVNNMSALILSYRNMKHKILWKYSKKYRLKRYAKSVDLLLRSGATYNYNQYRYEWKRHGIWVRDCLINDSIRRDMLTTLISQIFERIKKRPSSFAWGE